MDNTLIGSVLNALPLENMISSPLEAMIKAQIQASRLYADFLLAVCIKDGKAQSIQFDYDETLVDEKGVIQGVVKKTMRIPLMAAISHPNICIEEGTIDFELEVSQSEKDTTNRDIEASLEGSLGWGPFTVKVSGRVAQKSEQTRLTDTRAKYSIHTQVKRQAPPEALLRVIDFLTDAATKPGTQKDVGQPENFPKETTKPSQLSKLNQEKQDKNPDRTEKPTKQEQNESVT